MEGEDSGVAAVVTELGVGVARKDLSAVAIEDFNSIIYGFGFHD